MLPKDYIKKDHVKQDMTKQAKTIKRNVTSPQKHKQTKITKRSETRKIVPTSG